MSDRRARLLAGLLPLLAIHLGATASLAQTDAASTATAPASAPAVAITAVLTRLDACFARGDVAAYLAAFEPDHPGAHALLRQHLERLARAGAGLQRTSSPVTPPRQIGPRTVVRVRHTVRTADERTLLEDTMLVLRQGADGSLVPTCTIEIPTQWGCVRDDLFRCPPCNYEIGGVAGWLCVPMRPERARSLEAASFYLIGTDVACDVSVGIDDAAPAAATVARDLGETLVGLDSHAHPGPVEAWLPSTHADAPPAGFAGARLEISLPHDFDGRGGVACFYVMTFGGLQHVLLLRGSKAALGQHHTNVQALLASYRLLQTDVDLALAAARPLQHHTGGTLTSGVNQGSGNQSGGNQSGGNQSDGQSSYQNDRFGFRVAGPNGWRAEQRCGGAALRVLWSSPAGSRLWLTGYDVPQGLDRWCQRTADRWLQELLLRADLVAKSTAPADGAWAEHVTCNGGTRTLTCVPLHAGDQHPGGQHPAGHGPARERTLHVFLRDELLLVADLQPANDDDAAAMQAALASLRQQ